MPFLTRALLLFLTSLTAQDLYAASYCLSNKSFEMLSIRRILPLPREEWLQSTGKPARQHTYTSQKGVHWKKKEVNALISAYQYEKNLDVYQELTEKSISKIISRGYRDHFRPHLILRHVQSKINELHQQNLL